MTEEREAELWAKLEGDESRVARIACEALDAIDDMRHEAAAREAALAAQIHDQFGPTHAFPDVSDAVRDLLARAADGDRWREHAGQDFTDALKRFRRRTEAAEAESTDLRADAEKWRAADVDKLTREGRLRAESADLRAQLAAAKIKPHTHTWIKDGMGEFCSSCLLR
jgi:hypothetical protein